MTVPLGKFVQQQIDSQKLTVKEFSLLSGLGLSHVYQLLRGERTRPSTDTFEAVAKGLSMTPAEMLVALGKSAGVFDPEEAEALSLFRQVPPDKKTAAKDMLRGLAAHLPRGTTNRRLAEANKRSATACRELATGDHSTGHDGADAPLTKPYRRTRGFFPVAQRAFVVA